MSSTEVASARSGRVDPLPEVVARRWAFFIGAGALLFLSVGSRFYLSELFALLYLALNPRAPRGVIRTPRWVVGLGVIWGLGIVISDLNTTQAGLSTLVSLSNVTLALVDIVVVVRLLDTGGMSALLALARGLVASAAIMTALHPSLIGDEYLWKGIWAVPVTFFAVLFTVRKRQRLPVMLAIAAVDILLGYRSLGAITLVTAILPTSLPQSGEKSPVAAQRTMRLVALAIVFFVAAFSAASVYDSLAASGKLGQVAQEKYDSQSSGALGALGGGRPEIFFEFPAVLDSPVLGHGSVPRLTSQMADRGLQSYSDSGYSLDFASRQYLVYRGVIPTHSFLFQAWVEAGLLGAFFWVAVGAQVVRMTIRGTVMGTGAACAWLGCWMLWNILFSPFGAAARLTFASQFAALLFLMTTSQVLARTQSPSTKSRRPVLLRRFQLTH